MDTFAKKSPRKRKLPTANGNKMKPMKELTTSKNVQLLKKQKIFVCMNCHTDFESKCNLDEHMEMCTKSPRTPGRNTNLLLHCTDCISTFTSHTTLFKHRVLKHGLETPDKKLKELTRKKIVKEKSTHGGIPMNAKLRSMCASFKQKLDKSS